MEPEIQLVVELFIRLATLFRENPRPPMGDSFEEWLFWHTPAGEHYRSSRQGVARMDIPCEEPYFDRVLWQSLLEHPDLIAEKDGRRLGLECKSLEASAEFVATGKGIPCRTTIDFNSTVPCGQERYKGKFQRYASLRGNRFGYSTLWVCTAKSKAKPGCSPFCWWMGTISIATMPSTRSTATSVGEGSGPTEMAVFESGRCTFSPIR